MRRRNGMPCSATLKIILRPGNFRPMKEITGQMLPEKFPQKLYLILT